MRQVFLKRERTGGPQICDDIPTDAASGGEFKPCGVCGQQAAFGRSSVQDHQTKGDQPFQALVTRADRVQPAGHPAVLRLRTCFGAARCWRSPTLARLRPDSHRILQTVLDARRPAPGDPARVARA